MMNRGRQIRQVQIDEQTRQNRAEQRKQNVADFGCLSVIVIVLLGAFVAMASSFPQVLVPAAPIWAYWLTGAITSLAVMGLLAVLGGDMADVIVRIVIVAFMITVMSRVLVDAREKAQRRNKALSTPKVSETPKSSLR